MTGCMIPRAIEEQRTVDDRVEVTTEADTALTPEELALTAWCREGMLPVRLWRDEVPPGAWDGENG